MGSTMNRSASSELKALFAERTGTHASEWHLVFKARYGMREVFAALRDVYGDGDVATTLFTGCTAVDSIISSGLRPRYADIEFDTLGMSAARFEASTDDRAAIVQHTYGLIDTAACTAIARKIHDAGGLFVEDSAHCLARMVRGDDGLPMADISIHSFGIEKTFSNLHFGGAIWVNPHMADGAAHDRIVERLQACGPLPKRLDAAARRYANQMRLFAHLPAVLGRPLKRLLTERGLFEPGVCDAEQRGRLPYDSYQPSEWVAHEIVSSFPRLSGDEENRRAFGARYREGFEGDRRVTVPARMLSDASEQPLIRFPIIMQTREDACRLRERLMGRGLYSVDWYYQPFYPGVVDIRPYAISKDDERYQAYLKTFGGVVGLPTDIDPERADEVIDIVKSAVAE